MFSRFIKDQSGATSIEYAVIASLVSITIIGAGLSMGAKLNLMFNKASAGFE